MPFWKKDDLKKDKFVHGYVGKRKIPISDKENIEETIEIRSRSDGGSFLDIEQDYHYSFATNEQAQSKFDDIQKKLNVKKNTSNPSEQLLETKECWVRKESGLPRIEVSCMKSSEEYSDKVSEIMNNSEKLQSVLDKAEKNSDEVKKKMQDILY
jgi:hypothetical protein